MEQFHPFTPGPVFTNLTDRLTVCDACWLHTPCTLEQMENLDLISLDVVAVLCLSVIRTHKKRQDGGLWRRRLIPWCNIQRAKEQILETGKSPGRLLALTSKCPTLHWLASITSNGYTAANLVMHGNLIWVWFVDRVTQLDIDVGLLRNCLTFLENTPSCQEWSDIFHFL